MPIRQGSHVYRSVFGYDNPYVSSDLNDYAADYSNEHRLVFAYSGAKLEAYAKSRAQVRFGDLTHSWGDDFYERIYITPTLIDLGTIASPQTRSVELWNAFRFTESLLTDILLSEAQGIEVDGPGLPFTMSRLQFATYSFTVGTSGQPGVDIQALFDFSNVTDPPIVRIIGTRAVKFEVVPDVPVKEVWRWVSDIQVATAGNEQRISIDGEVPRVETSFKAVFVNEEEINKFYAQLLSSVGRLWIPEWQYAARSTAASSVGTDRIYFDPSHTDIREGEYVLISNQVESELVEVETMHVDGATVKSNIAIELPVNGLVVPGSPALLNDGSSVDRYSVNTAAETNLNCRFTRVRETLTRPESTVVLPTFLGDVVCEKRPLANSLVGDAFITGQEMIDAGNGAFDIVSWWQYSRVGGEREFKVNRVYEPESMDYWKALLAHARGETRKFWVPTYRNDLTLAIAPGNAASSMKLSGIRYVQNIYATITHRYIEIETELGIHRASITAAVENAGNTDISFTPALPSGLGWTNVKRISYLLPVRINAPSVEWTHYGLESILKFPIRTAEP